MLGYMSYLLCMLGNICHLLCILGNFCHQLWKHLSTTMHAGKQLSPAMHAGKHNMPSDLHAGTNLSQVCSEDFHSSPAYKGIPLIWSLIKPLGNLCILGYIYNLHVGIHQSPAFDDDVQSGLSISKSSPLIWSLSNLFETFACWDTSVTCPDDDVQSGLSISKSSPLIWSLIKPLCNLLDSQDCSPDMYFRHLMLINATWIDQRWQFLSSTSFNNMRPCITQLVMASHVIRSTVVNYKKKKSTCIQKVLVILLKWYILLLSLTVEEERIKEGHNEQKQIWHCYCGQAWGSNLGHPVAHFKLLTTQPLEVECPL